MYYTTFIVITFVSVPKYPTRTFFLGGGLTVLRNTVHGGGGTAVPQIPVRTQRGECQCSAYFLLFIQPGTATTLRVGPPSAAKPFWEH